MNISGELEIDYSRGVIYFHARHRETIERWGAPTILRVCQVPLAQYETPIDVIACNKLTDHA